MELRHLRYFAAVAEELSFTRAARRLHMAQPPLSQQIRALEDELGVPLLLRTRRRVELTAPGSQFLESARDILARAGEAVDRVRRAARGEEGELRLGFVATAMYEDAVPRLLREFRAGYPAVALRLEQIGTVQQVEALVEGRIDAGFLRPPVDDARLLLRKVTSEALILAVPADHPLAGKRPVRLRAFAADPWVIISRETGAGFYQRTFELCQRAGFTPRVSVETGEIQTVMGLVAAGFGVALAPAAVRKLRRSGVAYLPLARPRATVELCLACLRERPAPVLRNFLRLMGS